MTKYKSRITKPPEAAEQFARLAVDVWGVDPSEKNQDRLANAFLNAISAFIREVGLPETFSDMGVQADTDDQAIRRKGLRFLRLQSERNMLKWKQCLKAARGCAC